MLNLSLAAEFPDSSSELWDVQVSVSGLRLYEMFTTHGEICGAFECYSIFLASPERSSSTFCLIFCIMTLLSKDCKATCCALKQSNKNIFSRSRN